MAARHSISEIDDAISQLGFAFGTAALAACFFALLYWLYRPEVHENLGVAAYVAPPATALLPAPHKRDAPELATLLAAQPVSGGSFDQDYAQEPPKPARKVRKRVREPAPRQEAYEPWGSSQPWRDEARKRYSRDWNRGWSDGWNGRSGEWSSSNRSRYENRRFGVW